MRNTLALLARWARVLFYLALLPSFVRSTVVSVDGATASNASSGTITPKVFIITMFDEESGTWFGLSQFNILAHNITVPGLSPLFPQAHCTADGSICLLTTGEGEINAAVSITSLANSPLFDLRNTYFLIAGVAGINPKVGTIGGVAFARYAVQVGLQFEIDAREKPANFSTGYFPQGTTAPGQFPTILYGTEVFELNDNLRQLAIKMAKTATLSDDAGAKTYRANYASLSAFTAGAAAPSVIACDTATSDQFFSGVLLAEAFEQTTRLFTNGTGVYCTTQQEDNATLEALLRAALQGRVDFARVMSMRSGSDFDRQFPGQTAAENLFAGFTGFAPAIDNLRFAGLPVVQGIVKGWDSTFAKGVKPSNYIGDIFGSLGGKPDFGPGSLFNGHKAPARRRFARRFAEMRG